MSFTLNEEDQGADLQEEVRTSQWTEVYVTYTRYLGVWRVFKKAPGWRCCWDVEYALCRISVSLLCMARQYMKVQSCWVYIRPTVVWLLPPITVLLGLELACLANHRKQVSLPLSLQTEGSLVYNNFGHAWPGQTWVRGKGYVKAMFAFDFGLLLPGVVLLMVPQFAYDSASRFPIKCSSHETKKE